MQWSWVRKHLGVGMTLLAVAILAGVKGTASASTMLGSAFTYQGQLQQAGIPYTGSADFRFTLYDAPTDGSATPTGPLTLTNMSVTKGMFTVQLDFGTPFNGQAFWLEVQVRTPTGNGAFTVLAPRQSVTAVPYALRAIDATTAATANAINGQTAAQLVPPGTIVAFAGTAAPQGWLLCDGAAVSRTQYASLFSAIGTNWGTGAGTATFNVPDLRGRFLRGVDGGTGRDPDASTRTPSQAGGNPLSIGSVQGDVFKDHQHQFSLPRISGGGGACLYPDSAGENTTWNTAGVSNGLGGQETRPKNVYVNYIIKY